MAQPQAPVYRIIYSSHSRVASDQRPNVLADIFREARAKNKAAGITGALLLTDHYFAQALEGEESAVKGVYDRIAEDARHEKLSILESGEVGARVFSRWAMAEVSKSGRADIPLHATDGVIHPAARTPLTRDQSAVLKVMRDAIGADTV